MQRISQIAIGREVMKNQEEGKKYCERRPQLNFETESVL